jgi:hypothetical protein
LQASRHARRAATMAPASRPSGRWPSTTASEGNVGRFLLGFLVAIVLVVFLVVNCAQALF